MEFPKESRQPLYGLLYIGKLNKTVECAGHKVVLHTLTSKEYYEIGLLTTAYAGTKSEGISYKVATLAMAIENVDGEPLASPLGSDDKYSAKAKFDTVGDWYVGTVDTLFNAYIELEAEAKKIADELGETSDKSRK